MQHAKPQISCVAHQTILNTSYTLQLQMSRCFLGACELVTTAVTTVFAFCVVAHEQVPNLGSKFCILRKDDEELRIVLQLPRSSMRDVCSSNELARGSSYVRKLLMGLVILDAL